MGFQRSGTLRVTGTHEARAGVGCSTAPACGPRLEETSPVQKQQSPTLGLGRGRAELEAAGRSLVARSTRSAGPRTPGAPGRGLGGAWASPAPRASGSL